MEIITTRILVILIMVVGLMALYIFLDCLSNLK